MIRVAIACPAYRSLPATLRAKFAISSVLDVKPKR